MSQSQGQVDYSWVELGEFVRLLLAIVPIVPVHFSLRYLGNLLKGIIFDFDYMYLNVLLISIERDLHDYLGCIFLIV